MVVDETIIYSELGLTVRHLGHARPPGARRRTRHVEVKKIKKNKTLVAGVEWGDERGKEVLPSTTS